MAKFAAGFGTALGFLLLLIILAYAGVVKLPLVYPVECMTNDGRKKVGTVVLQLKETGDPGKQVACRVY